MIVKYENHLGDVIVLNDGIVAKLRRADFCSFEWKREDLEFTKEEKEYTAVVAIHSDDLKTDLNKIVDIFEADTLNKKEGKLWYGDQYLFCNVSRFYGYPDREKNEMTLEITFNSKRPFWIQEQKFEYYKGEADRAKDDYPHSYPYEYSKPIAGYSQIVNNHVAPANFVAIVYGPCENPRFFIGNNKYEVDLVLSEGEFLKIDSIKKTLVYTTFDGIKYNVFDRRNKEASVFEKVPAGSSSIVWDGAFGFEITLTQERSMPEWS